MFRFRIALAACAAATALVVVVPPAGARTVSAQPEAAVARTTLVFLVSGCEGCTIGVQRALTPGSSTVRPSKPDFWNGPRGKVSGGKLSLVVPTAWTPGMSFTLAAPWEGNDNAVDNIVIRYGTSVPGRSVTPAAAARATKATGCWAGTRNARYVFHVRVDRFVAPDMLGKRAVFARPYLNPAGASVGAMGDAYKGTIGNQEAYFC